MKYQVLSVVALLGITSGKMHAGEPLNYGPLPYPQVNPDTWVLIEYWPAVKDITLHAYFMDSLSGKNQNLCAAMKDAVDRDAAATAKKQGIPATAWRKCFTLRDAIAHDYVKRPND